MCSFFAENFSNQECYTKLIGWTSNLITIVTSNIISGTGFFSRTNLFVTVISHFLSTNIGFFVARFIIYCYTNFFTLKVFILFYLRNEKTFIDRIESEELLYIAQIHRLPIALKESIEKNLLEARAFPDKKADLQKFIDFSTKLPNKEELYIAKSINKNLNLTGLEEYSENIKKQFIEIYLSYMDGVKLFSYYFKGPYGVGKSNSLKVIAKSLGASIVHVSFAGASASDILGRASSSTGEGYIGLLGEAMIQASPYGESPLILFIDEIDKALNGPYGKEVEDIMLNLFERNNSTYYNFYLKCDVPLPSVIIFAGNESLSTAISNRLKIVEFKEYSWEIKARIIRRQLAKYCKNLHIELSSLTEEDYKNIDQIAKEMGKKAAQDPSNKSWLGIRLLEINVIKYIEKKNIQRNKANRQS